MSRSPVDMPTATTRTVAFASPARARAACRWALAIGSLATLALLSSAPARAVDPPGKVDCSKYTGTEREACEKMMGKKKQ